MASSQYLFSFSYKRTFKHGKFIWCQGYVFQNSELQKTYNYALQLKYKKLRQLDYLNNSLMNEEMNFWINYIKPS